MGRRVWTEKSPPDRQPNNTIREWATALDVRRGKGNGLDHKAQKAPLVVDGGPPIWLGGLGLMVNVIVLWQAVYIQAAVDHLVANGHGAGPADVARLSPLGQPHDQPARPVPDHRTEGGRLRPLRTAG